MFCTDPNNTVNASKQSKCPYLSVDPCFNRWPVDGVLGNTLSDTLPVKALLCSVKVTRNRIIWCSHLCYVRRLLANVYTKHNNNVILFLKATSLYLPVCVSVCNGVCPNNSKCASNFISTKDKNYWKLIYMYSVDHFCQTCWWKFRR